MRPESVEIKVTVAGDQVEPAVAALPLSDPARWDVVFCEDVTAGAVSTPLLELGVVLRVRRKSATKGDSTVKLRPCRWSQLDPAYVANSDDGATELKIEADWAGSGHQLAAAMTVKWADGRLSADTPVADLFGTEQHEFLARCAPGRVNLAALTALPPVSATRWSEFPAGDLSIRAERWTLEDGPDFLELSIVSTIDRAEADQTALRTVLTDHGLTEDPTPANKTGRILTLLASRV